MLFRSRELFWVRFFVRRRAGRLAGQLVWVELLAAVALVLVVLAVRARAACIFIAYIRGIVLRLDFGCRHDDLLAVYRYRIPLVMQALARLKKSLPAG